MRRSTTVAVIASAAALFAPGHEGGEALAQNPINCAPVLDETTPGEVHPLLAEVIEDYADEGVTIRAGIYNRAPGNVEDIDDVNVYQDQVAEACGERDTNNISVYISRSPRLFNTVAYGRTENDIPQEELDFARDDFIADLQDPDTPFQEDIANHLERINPYDERPVPGMGDGGSVTPNRDIDMPDIPWLYVLYGMGGVAVVGGGLLRVRRHTDLKQIYVSRKQTSAEMELNLYESSNAIRDELKGVAEGDSPSLLSAAELAERSQVTIDERAGLLSRAYRSQIFRIWPSVDRVQAEAAEYDTAHEEASHNLGTAQSLLTEFQSIKQELDATVSEFSEKIEKIATGIQKLKSEGWEIGEYEEEYADLKNIQNQALRLKDQNFVVKLSNILKDNTPEVESLIENISTLPSRRAAVDIELGEQPDTVAKAGVSIENSRELLSSLKDMYDESCYEDLVARESVLDEKLRNAETLQKESAKYLNIKSIDAVESAEKLSDEFDAVIGSIIETETLFSEREYLLQQLATDLPDRARILAEELKSAITFSAETYPEDVEQSTREEINRFSETYESILAELNKAKPRYLALDSSLSSASAQLTDLYSTAQAEKREMDELRSSSVTLAQEAGSLTRELENYVSRHSSAIASSISFMDIQNPNQNLNRSGLREQTQTYRETIASIEAEFKKAKRDVAEAEAERARQAAAAAAEAARRSAERSRRSSGGGGRSGGGFGGGGRSGGSFGGGRRSGGGW